MLPKKNRGLLNKKDFMNNVNVCIGDFLCLWAKNVSVDVVDRLITTIIIIKNIITVIVIFLPLVVGLSIGAIYGKAWDDPKYKNLKKPEYNPPSYVFGIVWPVLYLAIGIIYSYALYDYQTSSSNTANGSFKSITYFKDFKYWVIPALALLFNFLYIPSFFGENGLFNGFIVILFCLVLAIATLLQFYFQDNYDPNMKYYAILALLPYIVWLSFASYLSYSIYTLNSVAA
jgi:tryptophan-rich sensory protein